MEEPTEGKMPVDVEDLVLPQEQDDEVELTDIASELKKNIVDTETNNEGCLAKNITCKALEISEESQSDPTPNGPDILKSQLSANIAEEQCYDSAKNGPLIATKNPITLNSEVEEGYLPSKIAIKDGHEEKDHSSNEISQRKFDELKDNLNSPSKDSSPQNCPNKGDASDAIDKVELRTKTTSDLVEIVESSVESSISSTATTSGTSAVPTTSPTNSIYQVKWLNISHTEKATKGVGTPTKESSVLNSSKMAIVTQNENGPCPMLSIVNVLLLQRKLTLPEGCEVISAEQLLEYIGQL